MAWSADEWLKTIISNQEKLRKWKFIDKDDLGDLQPWRISASGHVVIPTKLIVKGQVWSQKKEFKEMKEIAMRNAIGSEWIQLEYQ